MSHSDQYEMCDRAIFRTGIAIERLKDELRPIARELEAIQTGIQRLETHP